jgi:hypothetical protein
MTRQLPASAFLRKRAGGKMNADGRPKPGTRLREIYDALRRGEDLHVKKNDGQAFIKLRDEYGMEFESRKGPHGYIRLIGEWEGETFVRLEQILQEDQCKS